MCCWIFQKHESSVWEIPRQQRERMLYNLPWRGTKEKNCVGLLLLCFSRLRAAQRARANFLNFQTSCSGRLAAKKTWCSNRKNSSMGIFKRSRRNSVAAISWITLGSIWPARAALKTNLFAEDFVYLEHFRELPEVAKLNYCEWHSTREAWKRLKKSKIEAGRKNHKQELKGTRLECQ